MSHEASTNFVRGVLARRPEVRSFARVLEFGSYNVNGTVRDLFDAPSAYVGVDWRDGPCVDVISLFHDFDRHNFGYHEPFDVLISVNTLEHDPYWPQSIAAGVKALRVGGAVIITVPTGNFGAHEVNCSPKKDHYQNLGIGQLRDVLREQGVEGDVVDNGDYQNPELYFDGTRVH